MVNKKSKFNTLSAEIAEISKAISHPARIEILKILAERSECICGEIVDLLPLAQSTISQHLKSLKNAGLVKGEVEGPRTCYCLDYEKIAKFKKDLNSIFSEIENFKDTRCC